METGIVCDRKLFIELLSLGEGQIRKLEEHLGEPSQAESCKTLAQEIQFIFRKAIALAKLGEPENGQPAACTIPTTDDSPRSASGSPRSEGSERAFKDLARRGLCKKRKALPKWTSQVHVGPGAGAEPPVDDGHSWRKYGQKDILGAKYPRGYYRCTHRNTQGCLAMKQVQRSSANPSIFDVTYRGQHTCYKRSRPTPAAMAKEQCNPAHQSQQQHQDQSLLQSFRESLKVKTEGLDSDEPVFDSSPFSFPSSPVGCLALESYIFSAPPTLESHLVESFSPTFASPTASEPNYYSVSPFRSSNMELVSASTSAANSPAVDMDFLLEFDTNFEMDASCFF